MTQFKKTLKNGAVLHGNKYVYTIVEPEQQDGFGITYIATGVPVNQPERARTGLGPGTAARPPKPVKFIVREHFMFHCSDRGDDDKELAIDEYSESTVEDFQNVFKNTIEKLKQATADDEEFLRIIEDFEANGTYYYVTEYLEGPSLQQYVEEHGALPVRDAKRFVGPVFKAMRRFHLNHILHTGLSPEAIIIATNPDGTVRPVLTQLYSCKIFNSGKEGELQLPPLSCPDRYAPREQYGELDKFLPQTNVYSLAAMITFALTGKEPPLAEDVDDETIMSILPEEVPLTFRTAIVKAMSPDWHDRFETVTSFNNALLSSIVTDDDRVRDEEHNNPHNRRRRRWRTWIAVLIVLALIVAVVAIVAVRI